jgi:hypothetical protein
MLWGGGAGQGVAAGELAARLNEIAKGEASALPKVMHNRLPSTPSTPSPPSFSSASSVAASQGVGKNVALGLAVVGGVGVLGAGGYGIYRAVKSN